MVETLQEKRYTSEQQVLEYLDMIARENIRLSRLIENFLTFSRMERNKQAFSFAAVYVDDVIAAAIDSMGDRLQSPACDLKVDVETDLPAVRGDVDRSPGRQLLRVPVPGVHFH